jgi:general secretion pathway protein I
MRNNSRGMTLIEVLVAFVILSLTMAVLMQIFSGGMRNAHLANVYSRAVFLAESRLAAAGVEQPLVPGDTAGTIGTDLNWRVNVAAVQDDGVTDRPLVPTRMYQVRVLVGWSEDGRERQVELTSLRLGPPQ